MHGANIFIHIPSTKTNTFTLKYVTNNNFTEMYSDMKKIIGKINETTEEIKVIVDRNNIIRIIENVLGKENYRSQFIIIYTYNIDIYIGFISYFTIKNNGI
mgnify:FL=1